jgi:hypothetical protein
MQLFLAFAIIFMSLCVLFTGMMIVYTMFRIFGIPIGFIPAKGQRDSISPDEFSKPRVPLDQFVPQTNKPIKLKVEADKFDVIKKATE